MATVRITLPDDLARDLAEAGLLEPQAIESVLRDRLRATPIADLGTIRAALTANPPEPMTNDEINGEIACTITSRADISCDASNTRRTTSASNARPSPLPCQARSIARRPRCTAGMCLGMFRRMAPVTSCARICPMLSAA